MTQALVLGGVLLAACLAVVAVLILALGGDRLNEHDHPAD